MSSIFRNILELSRTIAYYHTVMLAEERFNELYRTLRARGSLTVDRAAADFGVSPDTIRRDFNRLARDPAVRRTHGGVILESHDRDSTLEERRARASAQKHAIAAVAATLVNDHETIVVDAGSTTALMVNLINARDVTIITYSVEIAALAIRRENLQVYIAGGAVRSSTAAAVGEDTIRMIGSLQASRGFIGANGMSLRDGLMTPNYHEASVKRALLAISRENVLLADSTKCERRSLVRFADLAQIDLLITDGSVPPEFLTGARQIVGEVRVAS